MSNETERLPIWMGGDIIDDRPTELQQLKWENEQLRAHRGQFDANMSSILKQRDTEHEKERQALQRRIDELTIELEAEKLRNHATLAEELEGRCQEFEAIAGRYSTAFEDLRHNLTDVIDVAMAELGK